MEIILVPDDKEKWRMISILSYVIVLIGLGLPVWWHTTRVYRANLPLDTMLELQPICSVPLNVVVHASSNEKTRQIIQEIKNVLGSTVILTPHKDSISFSTPDSSPSLLFPSGTLILYEWPEAPHELMFSHQRVLYFQSSVSGTRLAHVLEAWPGVRSDTALIGGKSDNSGDVIVPDGRTFPAAREYDVLVTVVENDGLRLEWDLVETINEYITPYLSRLSPIANFTVKSQHLYFVDLGVRPRQVGDHWALAEQLLPHIITPLEKKLASHVSKRPCINLVVYIPSCDMSPIYIYTKAGLRSAGPTPAFISPRWGGVQIMNPQCSTPKFTPNTSLVMATMITQLGRLLGVPNAPQGTWTTDDPPASWQVEWMIRTRIKEYLDAASLTLRSLAQLLSEINNIVINDDVANSVHLAVSSASLAELFLMEGRIIDAFNSAQRAAEAAEAAFTDPTLLALLYFPDDQKYAVYIPLFLPIMIPVIMSMRQLVQYIRKPKIVQKCS